VIGLDTNLLVRYFTGDDPEHFRRAEAFIDALTVAEPGFIPLVTLAELTWVMRSRYSLSKADLIEMVEMLLRMPGFVLERADTVEKALRVFRGSRAAFSDALIERSAHDAGCAYTVTFDEKAVGNAGMRLVP
jgi:predicted nucleic-acid-binding protein